MRLSDRHNIIFGPKNSGYSVVASLLNFHCQVPGSNPVRGDELEIANNYTIAAAPTQRVILSQVDNCVDDMRVRNK